MNNVLQHSDTFTDGITEENRKKKNFKYIATMLWGKSSLALSHMWHTHNKRMGEIRNPKYTTFTKLVQVRNFMTFELKVIRHEERETQSFYTDCFYICPKPRAAHCLQTTGLASAGPESQPSRSDAELNSLLFLKSPKSSARTSGAWRHSHPLVLFLSVFFILTSVNDTSSPRAREPLR